MKKIIKTIIIELAKIKKVKAIYLFGSQATRKTWALSDIDICVIAPDATEKEKNEIQGYASKKVDVVLFTDLPLTIKNRIFQEGKSLYITDKKYISALAWRTTKEYWDFKPILKEFINEYLPGVTYV